MDACASTASTIWRRGYCPPANGDWDREAIADAARKDDQKKIRLSRAVPVAWVYLDAWESADGVVHFAPDVYDLDGAKDQG